MRDAIGTDTSRNERCALNGYLAKQKPKKQQTNRMCESINVKQLVYVYEMREYEKAFRALIAKRTNKCRTKTV